MNALPPGFYDGDTVDIARALLGKLLVRQHQGETMALRITETEAYVGRCDKGCHAYGYRRTPRTQVMFGPPGHAYVYLIYGMHHCLNLVTEPEGEPSAVLIRGGEPVLGRDAMARRRWGKIWADLSPAQRVHLADGPGKLCKALSITRAENALALTGPELYVTDDSAGLGLPPEGRSIIATKRIGIDYAEEARDFLWRFTYT